MNKIESLWLDQKSAQIICIQFWHWDQYSWYQFWEAHWDYKVSVSKLSLQDSRSWSQCWDLDLACLGLETGTLVHGSARLSKKSQSWQLLLILGWSWSWQPLNCSVSKSRSLDNLWCLSLNNQSKSKSKKVNFKLQTIATKLKGEQ